MVNNTPSKIQVREVSDYKINYFLNEKHIDIEYIKVLSKEEYYIELFECINNKITSSTNNEDKIKLLETGIIELLNLEKEFNPKKYRPNPLRSEDLKQKLNSIEKVSLNLLISQ